MNNEDFTLKIDSEGNNNYVFYEYYNGVNTGIFKLKAVSSPYVIELNGTYSKPGSNRLVGISLRAVPNSSTYPFYRGIVDNTPVAIAQTASQQGFYEKYADDSNIFNLKYAIQGPNQTKYGIDLTESFNGKVTGEYAVNFSDNNRVIKGIYIPASNKNVQYPVTLVAANSPN